MSQADHVAARGLHRGHLAASSADGGQVGERVDLHALALQSQFDDARLGLGEHVAPVAVLAHEVVHVHAAGAEALDDLERGDAAAHHHRDLALAAAAHDAARVVHAVQRDHSVQLGARHAGADGPGAGREQQAVVGELPAAHQGDPVGARVDRGRRLADPRQVQPAEVGGGEGEEALARQLVREVVRQTGPRVVAVRVLADDDDLGGFVGVADGLGGGDGRRPAADEDVPAGHVSRPGRRGRALPAPPPARPLVAPAPAPARP